MIRIQGGEEMLITGWNVITNKEIAFLYVIRAEFSAV